MSCSCKISTSFPTALPKQHGYFRVSGLVFSIIFLLLFTCALITIWVLPTQKDNIAHWLSEKVGHAVTIGEVDMVWQDNRPQLLLTSMKVLQDEGMGALSFTSLRLGLNIWASLVDQQLYIEQIALEGVSVTLVRNQQGMSFFQVTDTVGPSLVPIDVISALTELKKISLSAVTVNYFDRVSTVLTGRYIINDAVLTHEKGAWDSKTSVLLPSKLGKAIAIEASWQLDANSFDETTWQIEVVADSLLLDYFRSYLVLRNIQLQQGVMGAKIYSEGRGKNIVSIETTFQGEGWSLSHLPRSDFIHVDRIAGQFQWQQQAEQWQLKSQQLDVIIQGQQADITELEIRQYGQQIALSAKSFDLAVISMLKPLVASWLEQPEQYSISGLMQDLEISYDTASGVQQAKGQANDIVIRDDEHGVLMSNLSGEWSYSPSYSLFQFDSQDITIRPDENWQQAMHFEQVTGELIIQSVSDQVISIQTNELVISNPDMMVAVDGYSDYDLAVENILHNEIAIKVNYFDVTKWQDYIPSHFLDPDFSAWSENAFHAGQITHGQLVLEGEWSGFPYDRPETRQQGQFAWSAKVTDAELNYDENWPRLEKFTGTIAGHGQTLTIISESGEIAGYEVAQAQIDITPLWTEGALLRLTGVLNGDSDNGLSFLAKSPLKQRFGSFVSYAKAKGDSHIQLALTIPLTEPEAAQVSGQIALENNTLDLLLNPTLRIGNINGAIQFGNDGVSSPLLEGQWQTTPVKVAVASLGNATQIKVESLLSDALLLPYWPKEWPVFMSGQTEAELIITLQERQLGVFDLSMALHSSLAGMSIDLPAPIAKKAEQLKPLQLHYLPRSGGHIEYQIQYDKEYMTVTRDSDSGTAITLDMTVLDAVEWQHWVAKTDQRQTSEENATTIALKADLVSGYGQSWSEFSLEGEFNDVFWQVKVDSPDVTGQLRQQYHTADSRIYGDFERVSLQRINEMSPFLATDGPIAASTSFPDWPAVDITIRHLRLDQRLLGELYVMTTLEGPSWLLDKATLSHPDYHAEMIGEWSVKGNTPITTLQLHSSSEKLETLLINLLNEDTGLEAKRAIADIYLSWPDSPWRFNLQSTVGNVFFELEEGSIEQINPGTAGRLLGLLSITALPRRLSLDFHELFEDSMPFNTVTGNVAIKKGLAKTQKMVLDSETAVVEVTGEVDLLNERYDQQVTVTPNVASTLPAAGAVAGGPVGLGVGTAIFLMDKVSTALFNQNIINRISYDYALTGTWSEPVLSVMTENDAED